MPAAYKPRSSSGLQRDLVFLNSVKTASVYSVTTAACKAVTFASAVRVTQISIATTQSVKAIGSLRGESTETSRYRQGIKPIEGRKTKEGRQMLPAFFD